MCGFGKRVTAALIAVALVVGATGFAFSQALTSTSDVRIVAQKLEDGRVEFALEQDGERILPRVRFFPADARVGRWLRSSPVTVEIEQQVTTTAGGQAIILMPDVTSRVGVDLPSAAYWAEPIDPDSSGGCWIIGWNGSPANPGIFDAPLSESGTRFYVDLSGVDWVNVESYQGCALTRAN